MKQLREVPVPGQCFYRQSDIRKNPFERLQRGEPLPINAGHARILSQQRDSLRHFLHALRQSERSAFVDAHVVRRLDYLVCDPESCLRPSLAAGFYCTDGRAREDWSCAREHNG